MPTPRVAQHCVGSLFSADWTTSLRGFPERHDVVNQQAVRLSSGRDDHGVFSSRSAWDRPSVAERMTPTITNELRLPIRYPIPGASVMSYHQLAKLVGPLVKATKLQLEGMKIEKLGKNCQKLSKVNTKKAKADPEKAINDLKFFESDLVRVARNNLRTLNKKLVEAKKKLPTKPTRDPSLIKLDNDWQNAKNDEEYPREKAIRLGKKLATAIDDGSTALSTVEEYCREYRIHLIKAHRKCEAAAGYIAGATSTAKALSVLPFPSSGANAKFMQLTMDLPALKTLIDDVTQEMTALIQATEKLRKACDDERDELTRWKNDAIVDELIMNR